MNATIAWTPRVGELWTAHDGTFVEIVGDHPQAELVLLRKSEGGQEWTPYADLENRYEQKRCSKCGVPSTMQRMLGEHKGDPRAN